MAKLIAALLNHPSSWTQGTLGRRSDGSPVNSFDILHSLNPRTKQLEESNPSDEAKSFSLYGAVAMCYPAERHDLILDKLRSAIGKYTGKEQYVAQFNDRLETTHKDVLSVARIANV